MKEGSAGYRGSPRLVLGHLAQISMNNTEQQALFIIFGGTGDLAQRKLYPSLFNLYKRGYLKNHFAVIGTARRPWTDEHYHEVIKESIANMSDDEELLSLAAKSGCFGVFIGFESSNNDGLEELEKKFNARRLNDFRAAVRRIQKHRIIVTGSFIMGLDIDKKAATNR